MPISGYFDQAFANSGNLTAVPDAVQVNGSVSYIDGWGPYYAQDPDVYPATALLIDRAQTNQIFFDITTAIQYIQRNGASPFITTTMNGGTPYAYNKGAVTSYNAGSGLQNWISTAATNTTTPGAGGATWSPLGGSSTIYVGGTSGGSANAQTVTSAQGNFSSAAGEIVTFKAGFSVTSASTLVVDGAAALTMKVMATSGLRDTITGDIISGGEYMAIDDGTYLQIIGPTTNGLGNTSQTWQSLTGSRALGTTYTNSTGRPIFVVATIEAANVADTIRVTIGGTVSFYGSAGGQTDDASSAAFVVPNGVTYSAVASGGGSLYEWTELR